MTDAEALEAWATQGYALLPGLLDAATRAVLLERLTAILAGRAADPGLFYQAEGTTGRYADVAKVPGRRESGGPWRKIEGLERDPLFRTWITNPRFEALARAALAPPIRLYRAVVFVKEAHVGSDTPWHQDAGRLWGLSATPTFQLWTSLDDAPPEAGGLQVVPGSHRGGLVTPLGGVIPAEAAAGAVPVDVPARAGDVVLLHNLLWHRSGPNRTASTRRALTLALLPGTTACVRRRGAPRVFPVVFG